MKNKYYLGKCDYNGSGRGAEMKFIIDRLDLNKLNATEGKWDWQITVKRLTDGKQLTEKISGGEVLVDRMVRSLKEKLMHSEVPQ